MLQNALASSEARADELSEELARKPLSKDKLANKVSVLSHRLESVEAERERWQREAEQLEEVLANERVKYDALKRKLDIAESGPDKLTKKEINYWRGNAEKTEEQINSYKARIASLKRELREREADLAGHGAAQAAETPSSDAQPISEAKVDAAALRVQIAGLQGALATAHTERESLETELGSIRERLEQHADAAAAPQAEPHTAAIEAERDTLQHAIAELRSSLEASQASIHNAERERDTLAAELDTLKRALNEQAGPREELDRQIQLATAQLEEARAREEALRGELDTTRSDLETARSELEVTRTALTEQAQRVPDDAVPREQLDELHVELERAQQETREARNSLASAETELRDLRDAREGLAAELAEFHRRAEADQTEAHEADRRLEEITRELEETRQREAALRAELDDSKLSTEGHQETTHELNNAVAIAKHELAETQAALAELRDELREEKEYSANLSELANSRQDQITKLQDDVEEARERFEDAHWRLDKAQYFERLVARRKGLIRALIEALRAKNKAMVALKAGIDSLRTHKAMVEETQQKLLVRLESFKRELGAAKERIKELQAQSESAAKAQVQAQEASAESEQSALQERLATQAELIQSLENELKNAKAYKRDAESKDSEVAQLHEELETKNTIITRLQSDIDEQQRKLAKLRGSDSETVRLKALTEKDRSKIDVLERENAELRAMIESAEHSNASGGFTDERETELQAKIAELTEAVGKWKKKYEFLSAEAPAAYQHQSAAKQ